MLHLVVPCHVYQKLAVQSRLWFLHTFLPSIDPECPQVFILDRHDSHNHLELIELAMANKIHKVEMPSHTSNWPCECTVFKPLKDHYRSASQSKMNQYPGTVTCRANFTGLLAIA